MADYDRTELTPHGVPGVPYGDFTGKLLGQSFAAAVTVTAATSAALTTSVRFAAAVTATATTAPAALTTTIHFAAAIEGDAYTYGLIGSEYFGFQPGAFQPGSFQVDQELAPPAFQANAFQQPGFQIEQLLDAVRGDATATATATGTLQTAIRAAASVDATATASATELVASTGPWALLAAFYPFNAAVADALSGGTIQATATTSAALTTLITPAASVTVTAQTTAALTTTIAAASSVQATATVPPAALTTAIRLASAVSATATTTSALTVGISLAGSVTATALTAGALTTGIRFAAAITATAASSGVLIVAAEVSGHAIATATVSADLLTSSTAFSAAVTATATTTAGLATTISVTAAVSATATTAAALTVGITLAGAVDATATTTAALTVAIGFASSVTVTAAVAGDMRESAILAGSAVATTQTAGALSTGLDLEGDATATATSTGTVQTAILLSASVTAIATMLATALELPHGAVTLFPVPVRRRIFTVWDDSPAGWVVKTPIETFEIGLDFSRRFTVDESLASVLVSARDAVGADTSSQIVPASPTLNGGVVTVRCLGGTPGQRHVVQFRAVTSLGNSFEAELQLSIESTAYLLGYAAKQPAEVFPIGSDFAEWLTAGETLNAATVTAHNSVTGVPTTGVVLIGGGSIDQTRVVVRTHGGLNGERHLVRFQVPTSDSNTYEAAISLPVDET